MAGQEQRELAEGQFFDLVERNLPADETGGEPEELSTGEFILWMIGISGAVVLMRYVFSLLF